MNFLQQALGLLNVLIPIASMTGLLPQHAADVTQKIVALGNIVTGMAPPNSIENDIQDAVVLVGGLADAGIIDPANPAVVAIAKFKATEHDFLTKQVAVIGTFQVKDPANGELVHGILAAFRYDSPQGAQLGLS